MNRSQAQTLAEARVVEAQALLNAGCWSGAYYLIGYAVECGLKACILAHVERTGAIFEDRRFSERCWTHNIEDLVKVAGLESERGLTISRDLDFSMNWSVLKDWNEAVRYRSWTEIEARKLFEAVTNPNHGVLPWIKGRW